MTTSLGVMKMSKEIGNRIKTIRENASLTQDEAAKHLGISKEKFAGIELGSIFSNISNTKSIS